MIGVTPGPADSSNIPSMGSCQTILVPDNLAPDNLVLDNLVPDNLLLDNLVPDNSGVRLYSGARKSGARKVWSPTILVPDIFGVRRFSCLARHK